MTLRGTNTRAFAWGIDREFDQFIGSLQRRAHAAAELGHGAAAGGGDAPEVLCRWVASATAGAADPAALVQRAAVELLYGQLEAAQQYYSAAVEGYKAQEQPPQVAELGVLMATFRVLVECLLQEPQCPAARLQSTITATDALLELSGYSALAATLRSLHLAAQLQDTAAVRERMADVRAALARGTAVTRDGRPQIFGDWWFSLRAAAQEAAWRVDDAAQLEGVGLGPVELLQEMGQEPAPFNEYHGAVLSAQVLAPLTEAGRVADAWALYQRTAPRAWADPALAWTCAYHLRFVAGLLRAGQVEQWWVVIAPLERAMRQLHTMGTRQRMLVFAGAAAVAGVMPADARVPGFVVPGNAEGTEPYHRPELDDPALLLTAPGLTWGDAARAYRGFARELAASFASRGGGAQEVAAKLVERWEQPVAVGPAPEPPRGGLGGLYSVSELIDAATRPAVALLHPALEWAPLELAPVEVNPAITELDYQQCLVEAELVGAQMPSFFRRRALELAGEDTAQAPTGLAAQPGEMDGADPVFVRLAAAARQLRECDGGAGARLVPDLVEPVVREPGGRDPIGARLWGLELLAQYAQAQGEDADALALLREAALLAAEVGLHQSMFAAVVAAARLLARRELWADVIALTSYYRRDGGSGHQAALDLCVEECRARAKLRLGSGVTFDAPLQAGLLEQRGRLFDAARVWVFYYRCGTEAGGRPPRPQAVACVVRAVEAAAGVGEMAAARVGGGPVDPELLEDAAEFLRQVPAAKAVLPGTAHAPKSAALLATERARSLFAAAGQQVGAARCLLLLAEISQAEGDIEAARRFTDQLKKACAQPELDGFSGAYMVRRLEEKNEQLAKQPRGVFRLIVPEDKTE